MYCTIYVPLLCAHNPRAVYWHKSFFPVITITLFSCIKYQITMKIQQENRLKIVEYLFIYFALKKTLLLMVSPKYLCQNMLSKPVSMGKYDFWKVYNLAKCMWTFSNMTRCTTSSTSYVPAQYQIPLPQKEAPKLFNMIVAKTHTGPTEANINE